MRLKDKILTAISEDWKSLTLQFDYPKHAKAGVVPLYLFLSVLLFVLGICCCRVFIYPIFGAIILWNYLFLFDKRKMVYKNLYSVRRYEFLGTIYFSIILMLFLLPWVLS